MQLKGSFMGSRVGLVPRSTPSRAARRMSARAEKAAQAGTWLPGVDSPSWLEEGDLPGNRGFDVLNFGTDQNRLKWFRAAEQYNGQIAMMGVAGILGQELLGVQPVWFEAGAKDYIFPKTTLTAIEFLTFGALELTRYRGWKETGSTGVLNQFPFDPLKLASEQNAVKEIKNGRLAMIAFIGFVVQALVTRKGPLENLQDHLADPFGNNFITSIGNIQSVVGGGAPQVDAAEVQNAVATATS